MVMNKPGKYVLIGLPLIIIGVIIWYFSNIVVYILIAYVFSLIGHPVVKQLGRIHIGRYGIPKFLRALFTVILLWTVVFLFFRVFVPLIVAHANELAAIDVNKLIAEFELPVDQIQHFINKLRLGSETDISFTAFLSEKVRSILNFSVLSDLLGGLASFLGDMAIAILAISFITFFFLKDEKLFAQGLLLFVPSKHEAEVKHILSSTKELLTRYFIGIGLQITGIISLITIGMMVIGVDFRTGLVIGLLAGVFNVIPYVGPIIGTLVGMFLGIVTRLTPDIPPDFLPVIGYMFIVFVCVQIIDNIFFQPFIYSSSVHAHPLEVFLIILIAGSLAGVIGMLLAIPIYTIIRVIAKEFFSHFEIVQKITRKI